MNWVIWQQHKKQFAILGLLILGFAALAIPTGLHVQDVYQRALDNCTTAGDCSGLASQLFTHGFDATLFDLIKFPVLFMPALLAIFFGLLLVAREYTDGTHLLAWTQGVSRRKWLSTKVGWVVAGSALAAGLVSALSTWWWHTGNALHLTRFQPLDFAAQGIVPVASTLFAVVVAIAVGAWLKRILPALGVLIVVLLVVQIGVPMFVRPHYATPLLYSTELSIEGKNKGEGPYQIPTPPNAGSSWLVDAAITDRNGRPLNWVNPPEACSYTVEEATNRIRGGVGMQDGPDAYMDRDGGPAVSFRCLQKQGYHWEVRYHAANQYWKFQAIESALYLAASVPFIAATYWLVLRRDV